MRRAVSRGMPGSRGPQPKREDAGQRGPGRRDFVRAAPNLSCHRYRSTHPKQGNVYELALRVSAEDIDTINFLKIMTHRGM